jgi:membrane fusion protein
VELFRKEVAEARQQEWLGSVQLPGSRIGWAMAWGAALFVGCLLALLVFGQYTRSEQVNGQLLPAAGLALIAASHSGRVVELAVSEGEVVEAGQALLLIDTDREASRTGLVGEAVAIELSSQMQRLDEELAGLDQEWAERKQRLEQRLGLQQQQQARLSSQQAIRERQVDKARTLLDRIDPIRDSGQLSALQVHQYESGLLEAEAQLELVRLSQIQSDREVADLEEQLADLPRSRRTRSNELMQARAEIAQALARNAGDRVLVVSAAGSGRVSGLTVHVGQSVSAGEPLLAIHPENSELHAELWVPASAIGRIKLGGEVSLRYHAFPYQQYGQHHGEIIEIAYRALSPEEVRRRSGLQLLEPAYRVQVRPSQQYVSSRAAHFPLRTSMSLEATLMLDRRRLIELLGFHAGTAPANTVAVLDRTEEQES